MASFVSIKTKLIRSMMLIICIIFTIVLTLILFLNLQTLNASMAMTEKNIRNAIIAKGRTLTTNNSMAMRGMAEDNAFTAVQDLVSATVKGDSDIVYGIYMDNNQLPWAISTRQKIEAQSSSEPLVDTMSKWAASLNVSSFKSGKYGSEEVIEFAAPVLLDGEPLGVIRYGFSTEAMRKLLKEASRKGTMSIIQTILILLSLGVASVGGGFVVVKRQAGRITHPIGQLAESSKIIAAGNYGISVKTESDDEIGELAKDFESMRETIKKYTEHLQDLVDEKMQQVNDILNNIDQGLFTINLDGTVNPEHSARATSILRVPRLVGKPLQEILRCDEKAASEFKTWLDLVSKRHSTQRWSKLARLAPIQELELRLPEEENEIEYVSIDYQKIYDKSGQLSKIMILAKDETEKRLQEMQMQAERIQHENEMRTILGIANTPPDEIAEFMEDTSARMKQLHTAVKTYLDNVLQQRQEFPDTENYVITNEQIDVLYRDLHTIKGNSGSYGFDLLSKYAHEAEDLLEELREPITSRRGDTLQKLTAQLELMDKAVGIITDKITLIMGKDDEMTIRIPESRVRTIINRSVIAATKYTEADLRELFSECKMLTWKPIKTLTRKYQKIVAKASRSTHKNVEFTCIPTQLYLPPETFSHIDDILIHIIRNAVDHGIEPPQIREELGKGIGKITMEYQDHEGGKVIKISDDGAGIDTEKLTALCLQKKLITESEAASMSREQKFGLIFKAGISTAETVTDISGRGMGMDIVYNKIQSLKAKLKIDSILGKGTVFTIYLPDVNNKNS